MNATTLNMQRPIGAILMDAGILRADDAERIIQLQKAESLRFGDAALKLGILSEDDIRFALSKQFSYAYLPVGSESQVSEELVAAYHPFSHEVEQLRAIRSQLMLRWFDREARHTTLAIVSPGPSEGRSYVAGNLAIVFSQLGERTLLIDADLRAPRQHELFKLDNKLGFSNVLAGRADAGEAIIRIPSFTSLSVLTAGSMPPNPLELLSRSTFNDLLAYAGQHFDVVLIDTPSMASAVDAQIVAARAGAALVVARTIQSRMSAYQDLVDAVRRSGAEIVGSILNDPPLSKTYS